MQKKYSEAFSKIVENETDIEGMVAYYMYKQQKQEFTEKYIRQNSKVSDNDTLKNFHDTCLTDAAIRGYRSQSSELLQKYGQIVFLQKVRDLSKIENQLNEKNAFREGVKQSVVGSFVFAFLLFLIGLLINFSKEGGIKAILIKWLEGS